MSSCIVYKMFTSTYLHKLCDHRYFMSLESCSKVLSTAGKPRHIPQRQSRPYQPRACFLFRLSLRVHPCLRWPALKSFSSTHRFQLGNILSQVLYCAMIKLSIKFHPLIPMLSSYMPSGTLLLVILGSAKQCLTPSSSVDGRC